ncbi:MAG: hypothetical protein WDN04_04780 [Rhodospirillales bacterium]
MKYWFGYAMALLAMATTAHAESVIFASGKIYGASAQDTAARYLLNTGSKPVTIYQSAIRDEGGNTQALDLACGSTLAPGAGCIILSEIVDFRSAYDCEAEVSSSATLRGSFEMRTVPVGQSSTVVLQAQPLR